MSENIPQNSPEMNLDEKLRVRLQDDLLKDKWLEVNNIFAERKIKLRLNRINYRFLRDHIAKITPVLELRSDDLYKWKKAGLEERFQNLIHQVHEMELPLILNLELIEEINQVREILQSLESSVLAFSIDFLSGVHEEVFSLYRNLQTNFRIPVVFKVSNSSDLRFLLTRYYKKLGGNYVELSLNSIGISTTIEEITYKSDVFFIISNFLPSQLNHIKDISNVLLLDFTEIITTDKESIEKLSDFLK